VERGFQERLLERLARGLVVGPVSVGALESNRTQGPARVHELRRKDPPVAPEFAIEVELLDRHSKGVSPLDGGVEVDVPGEDLRELHGQLVLFADRIDGLEEARFDDSGRGSDPDLVFAGGDVGVQSVLTFRNAEGPEFVDGVGEGAELPVLPQGNPERPPRHHVLEVVARTRALHEIENLPGADHAGEGGGEGLAPFDLTPHDRESGRDRGHGQRLRAAGKEGGIDGQTDQACGNHQTQKELPQGSFFLLPKL